MINEHQLGLFHAKCDKGSYVFWFITPEVSRSATLLAWVQTHSRHPGPVAVVSCLKCPPVWFATVQSSIPETP